MSQNPTLTVCLTYYNSPDVLALCLRALEVSPPTVVHEVIIVDDASPVPAKDVIGGKRGVRILRLDRNLGFAGATNAGIAAAQGEYLLLLNCDTEVQPLAVDRMVEYLETHSDTAVVGPRLLNADRTTQPQGKRGRLTPLTGLAYSFGLDRLFPRSRVFGEYLMRYAPDEDTQDVRAVSGACMIVRRTAVDEVGRLDEGLVMYAEDLEWCYRFGAAGWRVVYLPSAAVIHHGGKGGTQFRFWRSLYYYHRALWVLFRRQAGPGFLIYGWAVALLLTLRFVMAGTRMVLTGQRRVGTAKGTETTSALFSGTQR